MNYKISSCYRQPTERFLYLYVNEECNLRCQHCYVGNDRLKKDTRITLDLASEIMEFFKITYGHDKLYILGGEPTLHPQLVDIIDCANHKGYAVTISTNGQFDTSILDKITPAIVSSLNFSIESANELIHTSIRKDKSNYLTAINNIKEAKKRGHQVRVMTTVSEKNASSALDMIELAERLNIDSLSFHNLGLTGNAANLLRPLSPEEWVKFCEEIESYHKPEKLSVFYPPTYTPISYLPKWVERGYPACPARTLDRPHILPDGSIFACPLTLDGNYAFAKYDQGRLILNSGRNNELNQYLTINQECNNCNDSRVCGGGCPLGNASLWVKTDRYKCDRNIIPLCILWTTHAWDVAPTKIIHEFR